MMIQNRNQALFVVASHYEEYRSFLYYAYSRALVLALAILEVYCLKGL